MVFFDSALETGDSEQISLVAALPREIRKGNSAKDWENLRQTVAQHQCQTGPDDGLPHGFAAGWVNYEGEFCFGIYDQALIYRHADESWHSLGTLHTQFLDAGEDPAAWHVDPTEGGLPSGNAPQNTPQNAPQNAPQNLRFRPELDRETFCAMVESAQRYIAAGDIYQVNLAHRFEAAWTGDAFAFYEDLRHYSPAPFGAFLRLDDRTLLSSSPESFLKMSGQAIRTRPIKGTRPRRADPKADEKSAYDLITSPKEIAELVMITDLERNDLGRVCEFGSVRVTELLKLERFEQVFHLVSTVEGRLRAEVDHVSALQACFPGGSITGAPKKRAREIISELEKGTRGIYTGAIGWFGFNGESQFNIAIRTVVLEEGRAHFHVGAGIVADSVPENEWQETLDKAAGILLAAERTGASRPAPAHPAHPVHPVHPAQTEADS
jgi:aminodeoxychorismate synthase component I